MKADGTGRRPENESPAHPCLRVGASGLQFHRAGRAVNRDLLAVLDYRRDDLRADDGGNLVFAGHDGGVREDATVVCNDRGSDGEERRPGWHRRRTDEDLAAVEAVGVVERHYHAGGAGDRAGRGAVAVYDPWVRVLRGRRAEEFGQYGVLSGVRRWRRT